MTIIDIVKKLKQESYEKFILDLGTGDGRFVYKTALENSNAVIVGVEPANTFKEYKREINRKKLKNAFIFQENAENLSLPKETFDEIHINLPWGTLLKYASDPNLDFYLNLASSLKLNGKIIVILGFSPHFEKTETKRLDLIDLDDRGKEFLKENLSKIPCLDLTSFKILKRNELQKIETSWAKKLAFGQDRDYLKFELTKN
jgi:16S rRNA (adenine(1408)-N(1))-methyltransferase